jgi:hypothetical protein
VIGELSHAALQKTFGPDPTGPFRSADDLAEYRVTHNTVSIDGLPELG